MAALTVVLGQMAAWQVAVIGALCCWHDSSGSTTAAPSASATGFSYRAYSTQKPTKPLGGFRAQDAVLCSRRPRAPAAARVTSQDAASPVPSLLRSVLTGLSLQEERWEKGLRVSIQVGDSHRGGVLRRDISSPESGQPSWCRPKTGAVLLGWGAAEPHCG